MKINIRTQGNICIYLLSNECNQRTNYMLEMHYINCKLWVTHQDIGFNIKHIQLVPP